MTILGAELSPLSDSVPVIIEVYDLLSGKHDGTITPLGSHHSVRQQVGYVCSGYSAAMPCFRNRRKAGHRDRAYL